MEFPKQTVRSGQGQPKPTAYELLRLWLYEKNEPMSLSMVGYRATVGRVYISDGRKPPSLIQEDRDP
jgi:hypothetical protein